MSVILKLQVGMHVVSAIDAVYLFVSCFLFIQRELLLSTPRTSFKCSVDTDMTSSVCWWHSC